MAMKTSAFDSAEYLDSPEAIETYLEDALESNDPTVIAHALGASARAKGMSRIAQDVGLSRESLYKALSADGDPELATVLKVIKALGLKLTIAPTHHAAQ
jgi:probable addiction module antidote protein